MSYAFEVIGEHSEGLVFISSALESIKTPDSPINVSLFQILHEIVPRDILGVASKLP